MKNLYKKLLFLITFVKVPKKQYGRCITCAANRICMEIRVCKCSNDQQYELRINLYNFYEKSKIKAEMDKRRAIQKRHDMS